MNHIESPIQTWLSWVVGDLFKPAACQMVWENVLTREPNPLKCNKTSYECTTKNVITAHGDQLTLSRIERGELPLQFHSHLFPRLLDSALLTGHGYQNRTFRIWGFFCAWLFVTLELACQIALTRLRILQPCAIGFDIWPGLAIECPTTVPLVVPHFSEAYQSGVC